VPWSLPNLSLSLALAASAGLLVLDSDQARAPSAPQAVQSCIPESDLADLARDPAQDILVRYLSRRFQIASEATERMVGVSFQVAREAGLDPLLVLAVISVESRFNPIAESVMGAKGLMQIIPKYHRARLSEYGGEAAIFDPESNIRVGTEILRDYVQRAGTLEAGLQFYNGAMRDSSAQYAQRVMAERARLLVALSGS